MDGLHWCGLLRMETSQWLSCFLEEEQTPNLPHWSEQKKKKALIWSQLSILCKLSHNIIIIIRTSGLRWYLLAVKVV